MQIKVICQVFFRPIFPVIQYCVALFYTLSGKTAQLTWTTVFSNKTELRIHVGGFGPVTHCLLLKAGALPAELLKHVTHCLLLKAGALPAELLKHVTHCLLLKAGALPAELLKHVTHCLLLKAGALPAELLEHVTHCLLLKAGALPAELLKHVTHCLLLKAGALPAELLKHVTYCLLLKAGALPAELLKHVTHCLLLKAGALPAELLKHVTHCLLLKAGALPAELLKHVTYCLLLKAGALPAELLEHVTHCLLLKAGALPAELWSRAAGWAESRQYCSKRHPSNCPGKQANCNSAIWNRSGLVSISHPCRHLNMLQALLSEFTSIKPVEKDILYICMYIYITVMTVIPFPASLCNEKFLKMSYENLFLSLIFYTVDTCSSSSV